MTSLRQIYQTPLHITKHIVTLASFGFWLMTLLHFCQFNVWMRIPPTLQLLSNFPCHHQNSLQGYNLPCNKHLLKVLVRSPRFLPLSTCSVLPLTLSSFILYVFLTRFVNFIIFLGLEGDWRKQKKNECYQMMIMKQWMDVISDALVQTKNARGRNVDQTSSVGRTQSPLCSFIQNHNQVTSSKYYIFSLLWFNN